MQEKLIYNFLLYAVFISALFVFLALWFIKAPYGRHYRKGWGLFTRARLGWIVMESPTVILMAFLFIIGNKSDNLVAIIFLAIWMSHYLQRAFVYPVLMKGGQKRFPLMVIAFALIFNLINTYINGRYLFYFAPDYGLDWLTSSRFVIGLLVFLLGLAINIHSDSILRELRKNNEQGYSIPHRGFFKYVSSPNYLGEIMEWIGWAILTWSLPGLAFAVFTIANLFPRAFSNHRWYRNNFEDYPEHRKAIIPFIL
ncbi:MAG: DUF1295 domain-containing protein [Actinomycetota bacterium]|nr:DUF1295 domain-containing protein [Actinomycetota bacterium]